MAEERRGSLTEVWRPIYTALACDVMDGMGLPHQCMDLAIHPCRGGGWLAGPALTLNVVAKEGKTPDPYGKVFEAYALMRGGEVVVIATNGEHRSGMWGELLATAAMARGVHATVTDGMVRDVRQMNEMGFACFARGRTPLDSAGRSLAVEVNGTVCCGGVTVNPGDFILADGDGVVVIPSGHKEQVLAKSQEKLRGEDTVRAELASGRSPREVFDQYGIL